MKHRINISTRSLGRGWRCLLSTLLVLVAGLQARAQGGTVMLDLGALDGLALTPDNITAFSVQSTLPAATEAEVKGSVRYRQSGQSFSYSFRTTLRPGLNRIDPASAHPRYERFSSAALQELFLTYKLLPQGTYQYCVSIQPKSANGEQVAAAADEQCLIGKSEDLFLINLVDPENNAKIHERNPVFSWIVNYPFASQLTYRIRVAELKQGQNNVTAITRNNPVYAESNLPQTTTTYPVYGKPLELFQPYAWTVDAYYKGLLLGGAEPWRFTIVEDSMLNGIPREVSYLDIAREGSGNLVYAIGELKLKYLLEDLKSDSLSMELYEGTRRIKLKTEQLGASMGDNRYEIDFYSDQQLRHLKTYTLLLKCHSGAKYSVQFKYVNPDFL
jgi:hypothetical protein